MGKMKQTETKWTSKQRDFIEWVATPEELREQRRFGDYADAVKVGRTTLWRWRKIPGFNEAVQEYAKQYLGDALPDALMALKDGARRGNFNHLKLYLEMLGMYTQKSEVKQELEITGGVNLYIPDNGRDKAE